MSKRNQIHQTRTAETQNWNDWNLPNVSTFSLFGSQNLSKRNQSHQTKINRRLELKWCESVRCEYFLKLWQPKPVQKESQPPNQKVRFDMVWISQIWILFQFLAAKTCPNGIKVTKLGDQNDRIEMIGISQIWFLCQFLEAKTCPKEIKITKPERKNYTLDMIWISQIWILFQSLAAQTCPKGIKIPEKCMSSWAVLRVRSGPGSVPVRDRVCGKPGLPCSLIGVLFQLLWSKMILNVMLCWLYQ